PTPPAELLPSFVATSVVLALGACAGTSPTRAATRRGAGVARAPAGRRPAWARHTGPPGGPASARYTAGTAARGATCVSPTATGERARARKNPHPTRREAPLH